MTDPEPTATSRFLQLSHVALATRPVYHKFDRTIRGHVFCSFLALVLNAAVEARIAALGEQAFWAEIIADLDRLDETEIEQDQKRFLIRSHLEPVPVSP